MAAEPTPAALRAVSPASRGFRVGVHCQRASGEPDGVGTAEAIDPAGVRLGGLSGSLDAAALGRYVWLDLELDGGEPVRALGEVVGSGPAVERALDIRFKHLFPDHRKRLMSALAADPNL